jgi:hypothetical protein
MLLKVREMWAHMGHSPWGVSKLQGQWGLGLKYLKKSTPRMGKEPEEWRKTHSNCLPLNDRTKAFSPQH